MIFFAKTYPKVNQNIPKNKMQPEKFLGRQMLNRIDPNVKLKTEIHSYFT